MYDKERMEEEREDLKERIFFCTSTVDYRLQSTESSMTNKSSADLVHSERCVTVQLSLSLSYLIILGCSALLLSLPLSVSGQFSRLHKALVMFLYEAGNEVQI